MPAQRAGWSDTGGMTNTCEDGQVLVLDVARGAFVPANEAGADDDHGPLDVLQ